MWDKIDDKTVESAVDMITWLKVKRKQKSEMFLFVTDWTTEFNKLVRAMCLRPAEQLRPATIFVFAKLSPSPSLGGVTFVFM